nr:sensor histidine kinase [uncultured Sphingomonas sp.]
MLRYETQKFNRLALASIVFAFALLLAAMGAIIYGARASSESNAKVDHTFQVKEKVRQLSELIERSETARRGYLLDPAPERSETYENSVAPIAPVLESLDSLTIDNQQQRAEIAKLRRLIKSLIADMDRSMGAGRAGQVAAARDMFATEADHSTIRDIRVATAAILSTEDQLLEERQSEELASQRLVGITLAVTALLLVITGIATVVIVRRYTVDLLASRKRLNLLNTDLEGAVAERTADLKRANEEIQRFAYIVSHDLRSPLVNVMGFTAELERADKVASEFVDQIASETPERVTDEVRFAVKEDLPEAIGFIRTSTQKMDRLINAILDLSRQGRRTLTPEHLPMDRIIGDVADSLAVAADERGATIRIEAPLPNLNQDRLVIEQIFSNLIENATKYLEVGRPGEIVIRGSTNGTRARFEVQDNGRGIAPQDHERIFELFRRSGQQDQKGEGIGLANVRSLAHRLGGTVTVISALSKGSTFVVDLPVHFSGEGVG